VEQDPTGIRIDVADLGSFARSLTDRRVLGLGEANHGTGDFLTYRGRLSLELARRGKLRTILLEADAIRMMEVDDYVNGESVNIDKAVSALRFWTIDVREFITFLNELRSYNATAPQEAKVHILGIDAQRLEPPVQFLLARRPALAISETEAGLLVRVAPDHGKAFTSLSNKDQEILLALLARLAEIKNPVDLSSASMRIATAARSIRYQLGYLTGVGADILRDQAMAEIASYIMDLSSSGQIAVWAHDDHIAREVTGAAKSLGQYLAEHYGEAYYPVAFLSYTGAARAWDASGAIGVIPHELGPAPLYNMETAIINATKATDAAWVRLDTATGALKRWLSTPRFVREFGAAYPPGDTQKLRAFPSGISAVVVIRHATASTPTPTGVRKASPP
jgi:erythromycin esterase